MSIFGLKSRKSYSSDTSSFSKHKPDNHHNNQEASDVIGDSPEFGQLNNNRRGPSHASEASSLLSRNSSSMKKFFGSTRRKDAQSIDGRSPSQPNKNLESCHYFNGATSKHASRTSLSNAKSALLPGPPPVVTPSAIVPSLSTPTDASASFAHAVAQNASAGLAGLPLSPSGGPRPSELFAGKGVQWGQIDLTARDLTKPTDAATTSVDMQKFLKERRQWIPTFKDSENVEEAPSLDLPNQLEQFSFDTPPEITKSSAGLKDLKDLEETHKRKNALLDKAPLTGATNGTIFEEAGPSTSTSVVGASDATADAKAGQSLPPPPAAPSRNQSFRTSTFAASNDSSSRKSGSLSRKPVPSVDPSANGVVVPASASASRGIPQRRSSVRKELSQLESTGSASKPTAAVATTATEAPASGTEQAQAAAEAPPPANGSVEQIKEQSAVSESARPGTAASGVAATPSVRPSTETARFATPAGSQSHDDVHIATAAANETDTTATPPLAVPSSPAANDMTHDSATTIATPTSPPRPPKNDQRTPSRQNSKDKINATPPTAPPSTQGKVESLREKFSQAAPSLQNVVPGTGAATPREG
ncbi:hypothetical protein NDA14_006874 [Ustilago hordei]|uniref:Uncharacterized protein n=1 Tax=Ustilago hordei TaxID=120017 RepID=I2FQ21_USTHO|nr:uncharacterized protein UHO2_06373 [Ustilago hordei]KAJ1038406.1 hypothetical protein NDA10_005567 [Ustilago hordei]KAJ1570334.1 hypothetical protein NDA15_001811 [Ustilago hordei]KAJ1571746.1 hypothetical protein NDA12_001749 [Ustilago hordei]KAJ1604246.1 hypothetical protein NDA14_006874 [Ustilago hordei]CCF49014.1 uncharacterized protein UHOR_08614 [Ustilago hordei]